MAKGNLINRCIPYRFFDDSVEQYLLCFHHSAGSASIFNKWQKFVDPSIGVCPVQLPGRENRYSEDCFTNFKDLLDSLFAELNDVVDKPFSFFGHSLGALLSYELTKKFIYANKSPDFLFVSSCSSPDLVDNDLLISEMSDAEFVELLKRYNGTRDNILQHIEMMRYFLPIARADFSVFTSYKKNMNKISVPIIAFASKNDEVTDVSHVEGWKKFTTCENFQMHVMGNGHFYYKDHGDSLCTILSKYMLMSQENKKNR